MFIIFQPVVKVFQIESFRQMIKMTHFNIGVYVNFATTTAKATATLLPTTMFEYSVY